MIKKEGILGFWKGIQPAWGRESFYASIKIGGYGPIREAIGAGDKDAPFILKFIAGVSFRFNWCCRGQSFRRDEDQDAGKRRQKYSRLLAIQRSIARARCRWLLPRLKCQC